MPVDFEIYPKRGFVLARFSGYVRLEECLSSAQAYSAHPDSNPTFNQLVDLTGVTGYERDFVQLMSTLAQLPDHLLKPGHEPMVVYIAPHRIAQEITTMVLRSVEGIGMLVTRVVADEAHALEILGQPERQLLQLSGGIR